MIDRHLVIVTEALPSVNFNDVESNIFDQTSHSQADNIRSFFGRIFRSVEIVTDLDVFEERAASLENDYVLPHWNGSGGRNRTCYATAICERHRLKYIGADSQARLVTNDKSLSKYFLRSANLDAPASILIRKPGQVGRLMALNPPLIVKPNCEGTSIGITAESVISENSDALPIALELLGRYPEGIIVEEFLTGPEATYSLIRQGEAAPLCIAAAERRLAHKPDHLHNNVYTTAMKLNPDISVASVPIEIDHEIAARSAELFHLVGGCDYLRLDGKITTSGFKTFEITADPLLDPSAAFLDNFNVCGHDANVVVETMVRSKFKIR